MYNFFPTQVIFENKGNASIEILLTKKMPCKNKLVFLAIIFLVFNQSLEIGARVNKNGEFLHF